MTFSLRMAPAIMYLSLCFGGGICSAQSGPPARPLAPPPTATTASGESLPLRTVKPPAESKAVSAERLPASAAKGPVSSEKAASGKAYVIGSLDVLDIQVWNAANLSGFFNVGSDGMISMPLLGQIKADGMTLAELNHVLRDRLAASVFTEAPEVNVQLVRNNSKKYTVFGAVVKPGEFPLNAEMTVMDAIGSFGGFRDFAKRKRIRIVRGKQTYFLNYEQVSHGKNLEQNIKLENGDWIFVDGD